MCETRKEEEIKDRGGKNEAGKIGCKPISYGTRSEKEKEATISQEEAFW